MQNSDNLRNEFNYSNTNHQYLYKELTILNYEKKDYNSGTMTKNEFKDINEEYGGRLAKARENEKIYPKKYNEKTKKL